MLTIAGSELINKQQVRRTQQGTMQTNVSEKKKIDFHLRKQSAINNNRAVKAWNKNETWN